MDRLKCGITLAVLGPILCEPISAQVTQRVALSTGGAIGYGSAPSLSGDGRFVAFHSISSNLVSGDGNNAFDIFVRDRQTGTTQRVAAGAGNSLYPAISEDGRFVAFYSHASNIVTGDTNGKIDVFVRDRQTGTTERVSVATGGTEGNGDCQRVPAISADGRYVAFFSGSSNLVAGDTNATWDVFVRDRQNGTTERVSVATGGVQASGEQPSISADGRYVAFLSYAQLVFPGDPNVLADIYVHDRQLGTTERASVSTAGVGTNAHCFEPSISADGRFVAFHSTASNLVAGDTNGFEDIFVRDRQLGTTERVSVSTGGGEGNGNSKHPSLSSDGRYVSFYGNTSNLVLGDTNGFDDAYVRDRQSATTERVSISSSGTQGNGSAELTSISGDGRYVAFGGTATNLVPGPLGAGAYVHDRMGGPNFTSLCDPGMGGVLACPCSNPPGGAGRGCNNSSSTGGAILSASGGTYLSSDSLVFSTSGEKPTALSILAQWIGFNSAGVVFGQGLRCTSGTFKRLFAKSASGGSITVPDFGAGDLSVHAQSIAKGDTISAGQSRWYVVYYRDNTVLGGCPATSNFNATQTGQVTWAP